MNAKQVTMINGMETWWSVCCENECSSWYYGPFFSEEEAIQECNIAFCEYSHFVARLLPPFAEAYGTKLSECSAHAMGGTALEDVVEFISLHNYRARMHPMHRYADSSADGKCEFAFTEALSKW